MKTKKQALQDLRF